MYALAVAYDQQVLRRRQVQCMMSAGYLQRFHYLTGQSSEVYLHLVQGETAQG
jgi:hypothetical protein